MHSERVQSTQATCPRPSLKARAAAAVAAVVVGATTLGGVLALYGDPDVAVVTARASEHEGVVAAPAGASLRVATGESFERRMDFDPGPGMGPRSSIRTRRCLSDRRLCA
jgi:hypothetical protein